VVLDAFLAGKSPQRRSPRLTPPRTASKPKYRASTKLLQIKVGCPQGRSRSEDLPYAVLAAHIHMGDNPEVRTHLDLVSGPRRSRRRRIPPVARRRCTSKEQGAHFRSGWGKSQLDSCPNGCNNLCLNNRLCTAILFNQGRNRPPYFSPRRRLGTGIDTGIGRPPRRLTQPDAHSLRPREIMRMEFAGAGWEPSPCILTDWGAEVFGAPIRVTIRRDCS
jgi:hypothetical protein